MYGFGIHPTDTHIATVDRLLTSEVPGITIPRQWLAIRAKYQDALNPTGSAIGAYGAAIAGNSKSADLDALRQAALVEALTSSTAAAEVDNGIRTAVHPALVAAYAPQAQPNYTSVAEQFTRAGQQLAECIATVDPDVDPERIINADPETREAWSSASLLALELDHLHPILEAVAELAGVNTSVAEVRLALVCAPGTAHRRRIWETWQGHTTTGRAGRWGQLITHGAVVRAANLETLEPYAQPEPVYISQVRERHGVRQVPVDPADIEYEQHQVVPA